MSDGPHKSLKMKPWWKKLAQRADIDAYNPAEVCESLEKALQSDFKKEVPDSALKEMRKIVEEAQSSLFSDHKQRIQSLLSEIPSGSLEHLLADCIIDQLDRQNRTPDPLQAAIKDALEIRASRHIRSIEEHYYRDGNRADEDNIRKRLGQAIQGSDLGKLASDLSNSESSLTRSTGKMSGLDEGPSL